MSISDQMARTTVRLECSTPHGISVGTSFLFRLEDDEQYPDNWTPLLITNRHVVEGAHTVRLMLSRAPDPRHASPADSHTIRVADAQNFVTYHPDPNCDLAAFFLGPIVHEMAAPDQPIQLNAVRIADFVDQETEEQMRYLEDILVVGYPQGIWDSYRNLPIFRSGVTASPAMLDYENEAKFLIDCSIFPGSSGSPVFLYNSGVIIDAKKNNASLGERFKLLGVVFAVQIFQANGQVVEQIAPTSAAQMAQVGMPNNLGVVVKAREILPLIEAVKHRIAQIKKQGKG